MVTKVTVLGAGAMGTTCAILLARRAELEVWLWGARPENAQVLRERRENVRLLPGIRIPDSVVLSTEISEAVANAELLIMAIPTPHMREVLRRIAPALPSTRQPVLSAAKGLERGSFLRPSEIISQTLGPRPVAAISGPGHAEEMSRGLPTSQVVSSPDQELARSIQLLFNSDRFRVYTNSDLCGVELAGALKNVIGIAAGICDGLGFGDNAKAALLTRGLAEMVRFGVALGAERQTFYGLAGVGDLITTCISRHGRNRRVGERIGQGEKPKDILGTMHQVAEGVFTARSIHDKARELALELPISSEVYRILYEDKEPLASLQDLMTREPGSET